MPNIKPISDLRNYNEVLRDVTAGEPVFLTKNGRGRYAVVDIQEYEKSQAMVKLLTELARGVRSGQEEGWLALDDVEKTLLGVKYGEGTDFSVGTAGYAEYPAVYRNGIGQSSSRPAYCRANPEGNSPVGAISAVRDTFAV